MVPENGGKVENWGIRDPDNLFRWQGKEERKQ